MHRVVLPSATGGTRAGLIVGAYGSSPSTRATGVVVARPASELQVSIAAMVDGLRASGGITSTVRTGLLADHAIDLGETPLGDGYGRPTATAEVPCCLPPSDLGLWDGERILFWHAGGLPGLFEPLD